MLRQLTISGAMALIVALLHFTALWVVFAWLRSNRPVWSAFRIAPVLVLFAAFLGVLGTHTVEIWLYAGLYMLGGAISDFETSLYFSAVSFLGYGDLIQAKPWRIVAAIEGGIGVILLGSSTAFIVAVVTELKPFDVRRLSRKRRPHSARFPVREVGTLNRSPRATDDGGVGTRE